jgi:hypothetical protein
VADINSLCGELPDVKINLYPETDMKYFKKDLGTVLIWGEMALW